MTLDKSADTDPHNARRHDTIRAIQWVDDRLVLLDQRKLPQAVDYLHLGSCQAVAAAITDMAVRGAPAIGIAAAYGAVLAAQAHYASAPGDWKYAVRADLGLLKQARPTAVNLAWAVERMAALIEALNGDPVDALLTEARRIHEEDVIANHRMGVAGATLIESGAVLTHCNTGSLATGGYGTALGVIRSAYTAGHIARVYADETRPWLQGSRLTAWELAQDRIPVTLLCEGAAASLLRRGEVRWIVVGADRVAANGDVANKIGTYNLAVNARHHGVRFMVVAPTSTIDPHTARGDDIRIENRAPEELLTLGERTLAPAGADAWNPVFDVTPAALIDVLVTERGVVHKPDAGKIAALMSEKVSDLQ